MGALLSPNPVMRFYDNNNNPLAGGQLWTYQAGTTTPVATFTDSTASTANTNPVILNARGEAPVWLTPAQSYKFVLEDAAGNTIFTCDQITSPAPVAVGNMHDEQGSGGTVGFVANVDFTPGTTTNLTLSQGYGSSANLWVAFDGAEQGGDTYAISGTTLTFNSPIPVGVNKVYVKGGTTLSVGTPGAGTITDSSIASPSRLYNRIHDIVDVKDFGATGNGSTDDTAAIQTAITAAGPNGYIYVPPGTYLLSATLNGLANQTIFGAGPNSSIFRRFADYGDTLKFAAASAVTVRGIWFWHGTMPATGDTTMSNTVTSSTAHLRLVATQQTLVEDCLFWRMPYGISIDSGSLVKIHRCNFDGIWDPLYTSKQEGVAAMVVGAAAYTQIVSISKCYVQGVGSGPRNMTWTSSDTGTHTATNVIQDTGFRYSVEIIQCEDLLIEGNYFGGNEIACIGANLASGSVNLDWRIIGNFLDGAGAQSVSGALMYLTTGANGTYISGLVISSNVFNGEEQTYQGIVAYNPLGTSPVIANFTIIGNSFQAIVGSAVLLYNAVGGRVVGNMIAAYNCLNYSSADPNFVIGLFFSANCLSVMVEANTFGGAVNSGGPPSFCYQGMNNSGSVGSIVERNSFWNGCGAAGNLIGRIDSVAVTVAGTYAMQGWEDIVLVNNTSGVAAQITLPANVPAGYQCSVKDSGGNASSLNIQIVGTVDGVVNPVYNTNLVVKKFRSYGAGTWALVGN